jgi:hypothetical protein
MKASKSLVGRQIVEAEAKQGQPKSQSINPLSRGVAI